VKETVSDEAREDQWGVRSMGHFPSVTSTSTTKNTSLIQFWWRSDQFFFQRYEPNCTKCPPISQSESLKDSYFRIQTRTYDF